VLQGVGNGGGPVPADVVAAATRGGKKQNQEERNRRSWKEREAEGGGMGRKGVRNIPFNCVWAGTIGDQFMKAGKP
jgi:hypothetical protein